MNLSIGNSSHWLISDKLGLAICTRNRSRYLEGLLISLRALDYCPAFILIVDSSDQDEHRLGNKKSVDLGRVDGLNVTLIDDSPGLPHQRNTAISWVRSNYPNVKYLSFLDDDIRVTASYFFEAEEILGDNLDVVVLGGFDSQIEKPKAHPFLSKIGILPLKAGTVAKSGLSIVPFPTLDLEEVDFVPGGIQTINLELFGDTRLDESSRIYGEDIELHLRLAKHGRIVSSRRLPVSHMAATAGKESVFDRTLGENLVRLRLHFLVPTRISITYLSLSTVLLATQAILGTRRSIPEKLEATRAHLRFLRILAKQKELGSTLAE